jgi:hypothetical protein
MTYNTTGTLECAAQLNPAASEMLISGSGVTAPSRDPQAGYSRVRAARDGLRTCRGPGPPAHREDVYFRIADFFGGADFFPGAAFGLGGLRASLKALHPRAAEIAAEMTLKTLGILPRRTAGRRTPRSRACFGTALNARSKAVLGEDPAGKRP